LDCQNISPPTGHVLVIQRSGTDDHEITSLEHLHLIPVCQQTPQALLQHSSSNESAAGREAQEEQRRSASKGSITFSTGNWQHDGSRVQICRNQFGLLLRSDSNSSSSSVARAPEELEATAELTKTFAGRRRRRIPMRSKSKGRCWRCSEDAASDEGKR